MKIRVDRFKCVGLGNCVDFAPTVFALDEERKARVIDQNSVNNETLLEAAKSCPVKAIIIKDESGTNYIHKVNGHIHGRG
jgi:ferredoxin